ncbi:MAG: hypothetical protein ACOCYU_04075 [Brevefilum sp.]
MFIGCWWDESEFVSLTSESCESPPDLNIQITTVGEDCDNIPVSITITNNGNLSARNVQVELRIDAGQNYVESITQPSSISEIPGGESRSTTATIVTDPSMWYSAIGQEIHFTASILGFTADTATSLGSEENCCTPPPDDPYSDSGIATHPGNCSAPAVGITTSCVYEDDTSKAAITINYSQAEIASLGYNFTGHSSDPNDYNTNTYGSIIQTSLSGTIYVSWVGAPGYADGSGEFVFNVEACEPTSVTITENCTWDGTSINTVTINYDSNKIATVYYNFTGNASDNNEYDGAPISASSAGTIHISWIGQTGYDDGNDQFDFDAEGCEPTSVTISENCTWDGASINTVTINYDSNEIATVYYNFTGNDSDNVEYDGYPILVSSAGTIYISWIGQTGYDDGDDEFSFDIESCEPPNLTITIESVGSSCEDIPVVIKVTNNGGKAAVDVDVRIRIKDPYKKYVDNIEDRFPKYDFTFAEVPPNGGSVTRTVTIYTKPEIWKPAPAGTEIRFWVKILEFEADTATAPEPDENCCHNPHRADGIAVHPETCLAELTLSFGCEDDYRHKWTVNNPNDIDVWYIWEADPSPHGAIEANNIYTLIPAGGNGIFYTSSPSQTVTITYRFTNTSSAPTFTATAAAEACEIPPSYTVECQMVNGEFKHVWTFTNLNSFPVRVKIVGEYSDGTNFRLNYQAIPAVQNGGELIRYTDYLAHESVTIYYKAKTMNGITETEHTIHHGDEAACEVDMSISIEEVGSSCEDFEFDLTITNNSTEYAASNVLVTFQITGGNSYYSNHTFSPNPPAFASIPPSGEETITISFDINETAWIPAAPGTRIEYNASVSADQPDLLLTNNQDTSFVERPEGSCEKSGLAIEVTAGEGGCEDFTFDITVTNDAQFTTLTAVDLTVEITSGTTYLSDFTVNPYLEENLGDMAPGTSITKTLTVDTNEALWKPAPATSSIAFDILAISDNGFSAEESGAAEHPGGCRINPVVDYKCRDYDNSHIWVVENPNPFPIEFSWRFDTDADYSITWETIAANRTFEFTPTSCLQQSLTIKFKYGSELEIPLETVFAEACKFDGLDIEFLCGYPSDTALFWEVENPFEDQDLTFTWKVNGSTEKGSETVQGGGSITFTTSLGQKTVIISVSGNEVDRADSGDYCRFDLGLNYVCLDNGSHYWTVSNSNNFSISYTRYVDGVAQGKETIPAGETQYFTTGNGEHTVTLKHLDEPFGLKVVNSHAENCEIPPPPSSQSSPPTSATFTCPQWIVFHTWRDGNVEIYRLDGVEGIGDYQLVNLSKHEAADTCPSRSFDDEWIAFQSDRDGNNEIYYTDNMGNSQIRLTDNEAEDINPMFGPDNINIVFQSDRNGSWDLYMVNRLTGEETQLTDHENDEINPFFSYNGNYLVFESNRNGNWDIFLLNLVTGNEYQITDGDGDEIYPALSPNGQKVAFLTQVDGIWDVFVIGIDGQNQIQITDANGDSFNHAWSPDGTRLAYQSDREGNIDIYSYDLMNNTEYRVTDNPGSDIGPTWDCGGTYLAFTTVIEDKQPDIYRAYWKGGGFSYLTNHLEIDELSEWSPAKETASRGQ